MGSAFAVASMLMVGIVSSALSLLNKRFIGGAEMTLALVILVIAAVVTAVFWFIPKKNGPILTMYSGLYLLVLYAPILILPIFAFNSSKVVAFPLQGFTTGLVREMLADQNLRIAAKNSLIIALSTAIAVDGAWDLRRPRLGAVPLSGQGPDHGPDHAAAGSA